MTRINSLISRKPKETLVLTLLVKNEADIIVDNVFYHYSKDVDHIIVTDNGSTDGTLEILEALQKDGLIYLLKEELYNQDKIVNKMGSLAKDHFKATILIHADADEFWTPLNSNSLKKTFVGIGQPSVNVDRKDVLPIPQMRAKDFPQTSMNIVKQHLDSNDIKNDSIKTSLFLFRLPPKVMFSVKDKLKLVGIGNHNLTEGGKSNTTNKIVIYHFPFKSAERFKEKVIMAGKAMEKITTTKETFWHWKRWYYEYKRGKLDQEIEILTPDLHTVAGLKYEEFDYNSKIRRPILKNRKLKKLYLKHSTIPKLNRAGKYV